MGGGQVERTGAAGVGDDPTVVQHDPGVDGARHKHPEMTTPMIVVDRLTPVRF